MFAKPLTEDLDVFDERNNGNDVLVCLHSIRLLNIKTLQDLIVGDHTYCGLFKISKGREEDLKHGC